MNERVKKFFLGDDAVWGEISETLIAQMSVPLGRKFFNLPLDLIQDCFADWVAEFYFEVITARAKAAEAYRSLKDKGEIALDDLKIEFCCLETKFDLRRGTPFAAWVWRVLYHRCVSLHRKFVKDRTHYKELDENDAQQFDLETEIIENLDDKLRSDEDLKNYLPFLNRIIVRVLEGDELTYFEIWMEKGPDPAGKEVISEFARHTGKRISNAQVTKLKQRFLIKSYLALRETRDQADKLSFLFRRFVQSSEMQSQFFGIMLENVWKSFIGDEPAVAAVKQNLPHYRWRELFQMSETGNSKQKFRIEILKIAYEYFKTNGSQPDFYRLIKFYSNERFGGEIRDLFGED